MTQTHQNPSVPWADRLGRLDRPLRDAVSAALRHSAETGWPAPDDVVEPLVAYALGEITAHEYSRRVLLALDLDSDVASGTSPQAAAVDRSVDDESAAVPQVAREDAVQAYVTGRITVGEFLRITRG